MIRVFVLLSVVVSAVALGVARPSLPQLVQRVAEAGGLATFAQGGKQALATALAAATLSLSAPVPSVVAQENWQRVNSRSASHLKSTFYLLLDAGDLWRVMHVEYLGMNEDDEPLLAGLRAFTVVRDGKGVAHDILDEVEVSLVGYDGLIEQGIAIEVKKVLLHPERSFLDLLVLSVADVDLSEYEPVKVELWPMKMLTELEMLTYRADLVDNELGFFAYPAMRRSCVAGNFFVKQGVAMHSCVVPQMPSSISSPIFVKESGALVALHIGYNDDGLPYAVAAPPALVRISNTALAADGAEKVATTWGRIKTPRGER